MFLAEKSSKCSVDVAPAFLKHVDYGGAIIATTKSFLYGLNIPRREDIEGQFRVFGGIFIGLRDVFENRGFGDVVGIVWGAGNFGIVGSLDVGPFIFRIDGSLLFRVSTDAFREPAPGGLRPSEQPSARAVQRTDGRVMFEVLSRGQQRPIEAQKNPTHMECNMDDFPMLIRGRINVSKCLYTVHCVDIDIHPEGLAECL